MKENIQTSRLANDLTILTEKMPDVRSATLGFWLKTGSRNEPKNLNGICHFIEHAVFKGTKRRGALDIAMETDRLGGNLDAFTSHETTGFMIKVVDEKISEAFDLIADMITSPRFEEKELKRERKVIFEEMKMVEDAPEELLSELFLRDFFPAHALGLPIEGTRKTVKTFDRKTVAEFHAENYLPQNIVIACAGNVEHQQIVNLTEKFFNSANSAFSVEQSALPPKPSFAAPILLKNKSNLEQAHLIIAAPWIAANDERRYAGSLLTSILGDGNSSRLWQNVREKRGLAYSVGASVSTFEDCGVFSIYAGTSPEKLGEVVDLSIREIRLIKQKGVSAEELNLAKEQTVSAILLGLESTSVRADALATSEIVFGRQISVEETLEKIENVSAEQVREIAGEFFHTDKIALAALGSLNGLRIDRARLDVN